MGRRGRDLGRLIAHAEIALRRLRECRRFDRRDLRALDLAADALLEELRRDAPRRVVPKAPPSPRGCMI